MARLTTARTAPAPARLPARFIRRAATFRSGEPAVNSGWLKNLVPVVTAVAGGIVAVYSAAYLVLPTLKPRDVLGATLDAISVETQVSLGRYRSIIGMETDQTAPANQQLGEMVLVHASLHGYRARLYTVEVVAVDVQTRSRLSTETRPGYVLNQCESLSPTADEDGIVWRCWTANVSPARPHVIRAELYDQGPADGSIPRDTRMLAFLESPTVQPLTAVPSASATSP